MNPLAVVIGAIAAYRVSYLIAREEGPLGVFALLRERIDPHQKTWVGRGLNCVLCVSFWVTLAVSIIIGVSWLEWLAMAGLIVMWREAVSK